MERALKRTPMSPEEITRLLSDLGCSDAAKRLETRAILTGIGNSIVPHLLQLLSHATPRLRLEAVRVLKEIKDPGSAESLVRCLMDGTMEIQWVAAEALVALGDECVVPMLQALTLHFDAIPLRRGAHHVLHSWQSGGRLTPDLQAVLETLTELVPEETIAATAEKALRARESLSG